MEQIYSLLDNLDLIEITKNLIRIFIIILGTWIAIKIKNKLINKLQNHLMTKSAKQGEPPTESNKRVETLTKLINQGISFTLYSMAILIGLKEMGIDVGPIIASVGVVGVAVGFGAQNLVRDFISGFFMILENQVRINDVAIINGTGGLVEEINLRTIVLRDLGGIVHVFPNGSINTLSNLTNEWSAYVFDIGVAYKENTDRVIAIMKEVGDKLFSDEHFGKLMLKAPEIFGVDQFADSAVMIKGRIETKPIRQWDVGREYLRRIKLAFDENDIEIPFPHRTLFLGGGETERLNAVLNNKA